MTGVMHPAPYSAEVLATIGRLIREEVRDRRAAGESGFLRVLDPFAGVGRIHQLNRPGHVETIGVEIEPEWAACSERTVCADSLEWMHQRARRGGSSRFPVIATSVTYGNRFSDSHTAKDGSTRRSYTHDLRATTGDPDRKLHPNNSGAMPWGPRYWQFHGAAYRAMFAVLEPGGVLLLNVSDFVRGQEMVHAVEWHLGAAYGVGFVMRQRPAVVATPRMRYGKNHDARAPHEVVLRLRKERG